MRLDDLKGPFQPGQFHDSAILIQSPPAQPAVWGQDGPLREGLWVLMSFDQPFLTSLYKQSLAGHELGTHNIELLT